MTKPKIRTLKPRLREMGTMLEGMGVKTLKQRQQETGRTLSLNGVVWRRLRAHILAGEPLCRQCVREGRTEPATDVDHHDNDPSNNDPLNLVPLCHACHSRKTQADMGKTVRHAFDADGMPTDPSHPWFKKSPATDRNEPRPLSRVTAKSAS